MKILLTAILVTSLLLLCFCSENNTNNPNNNNTETITICNKVWMKKNLDVEKYRNGDIIPYVTDHTEWHNRTTGAWCYYNNDPANNEKYGKLYNWYAVNDSRGLAPEGWHIPTDAEWIELENCLGGSEIAGGKLKSTGNNSEGNGLWDSPNEGASNQSGFTALPSGWRYFEGRFEYFGAYGLWWTATETASTTAWGRNLRSTDAAIGRISYRKDYGFSVRCVKD